MFILFYFVIDIFDIDIEIIIMKKLAQRLFRDNLDTNVLHQFKKKYPHFEYERKFRRIPLYPKIVLYSNVTSVDRFLEQ